MALWLLSLSEFSWNTKDLKEFSLEFLYNHGFLGVCVVYRTFLRRRNTQKDTELPPHNDHSSPSLSSDTFVHRINK